jgi:hypothetical protein
MYRQRSMSTKALVTKFTLDGFLFRVNPQMHRQILSGRKLLITVSTLERFLSGVNPQMVRQTRGRRQSFSTKIAQVSFRSFTVVQVHVTLVILLRLVHLIAHVTRKLRRLVVLQLVSVEGRPPHRDFSAHVTTNPRFVVFAHVTEKRVLPQMVVNFTAILTSVLDFCVLVKLHVSFEVVLVFETRTAVTTLERSLFAVANTVKSQFPIFSEALAAHDTSVIFALVHVQAVLP